MTGVRIRWAMLGKVAAIAVAGLALLQVLPGLLRAPEPPPLAADVGLPRVKVVAPGPGVKTPARASARARVAPRSPAREPKRRAGPAGTAVIASTPRHRKVTPRASKPAPEPVATAPVQPPAASPPAAPTTAVETQPAAAPEPPNDGSIEFAPR